MKVIPKNRREAVAVQRRVFNERAFIDIRIHYWDTDGTLKPTGKGVTISPDKALDVAKAIEQVARQEAVDDD